MFAWTKNNYPINQLKIGLFYITYRVIIKYCFTLNANLITLYFSQNIACRGFSYTLVYVPCAMVQQSLPFQIQFMVLNMALNKKWS